MSGSAAQSCRRWHPGVCRCRLLSSLDGDKPWRGCAYRYALPFLAIPTPDSIYHTVLIFRDQLLACTSHQILTRTAIHHPKACLAAVALGQLGVGTRLPRSSSLPTAPWPIKLSASCRQARGDLALPVSFFSSLLSTCAVWQCRLHACMSACLHAMYASFPVSRPHEANNSSLASPWDWPTTREACAPP